MLVNSTSLDIPMSTTGHIYLFFLALLRLFTRNSKKNFPILFHEYTILQHLSALITKSFF